ncbi:hypothetical protein NA78x_001762 [Anatilimnocola sp. NA78]|uniref:LexA family protein n=1 Tax=Anatilimnocola sp. NA78 TaxID=3415683 RepID=UPI003CE594B6
MSELTARQRLVYDAIVSLTGEFKRSPTFREIGAKVGIVSPNGVCGHVRALVAKGYIEHGRQARSIRLLQVDVCPHCGAKKA